MAVVVVLCCYYVNNVTYLSLCFIVLRDLSLSPHDSIEFEVAVWIQLHDNTITSKTAILSHSDTDETWEPAPLHHNDADNDNSSHQRVPIKQQINKNINNNKQANTQTNKLQATKQIS